MSARISVILPVYNAAAYLAQCIESLLWQTRQPDELIVIDDHSTDGSYELLLTYAARYPFIRLYRLEPKKQAERRTARCWNEGIALATGDYIALMDADDWCDPQRLQVQQAFLDAHPGVIAVGSAVRAAPKGYVMQKPLMHETLQPALIRSSPFFQNTVMMRRTVITQHQLRYDESFEYAEDYEFFSRLIRYGEVRNLPQALVHYRMHGAQSISHAAFSEYLKRITMREAAQALKLDAAQTEAYWAFVNHRQGMLPGQLPTLLKQRDFLLKRNAEIGFADAKLFAQLLDSILLERIISRRSYNPRMIAQLKHVMPETIRQRRREVMRFVAKCLLLRRRA